MFHAIITQVEGSVLEYLGFLSHLDRTRPYSFSVLLNLEVLLMFHADTELFEQGSFLNRSLFIFYPFRSLRIRAVFFFFHCQAILYMTVFFSKPAVFKASSHKRRYG